MPTAHHPGGTPRVTAIDFHDPEWTEPSVAWAFSFWVTVTVGDDLGGSNFQVQVCSPSALPHVRDRDALFVLDEWGGEEDLLHRLNEFVARVADDAQEDALRALARHWLWEYGGQLPFGER